ncbi:unnamed protein product [[Candida] boidinii]|uniref:Unnamed protein product n=1 Tax=Candida boidinii TaxID=5477 RepID=A0A9W6T4R8_CANBO|nr:unnamed protein product [[Candida] boidinii]
MPADQINKLGNNFEVPTLFKSDGKNSITTQLSNTNAAITASPSLSSPTGIPGPTATQKAGLNRFSIPTSLSPDSNSPINHAIHSAVKTSSASNTPSAAILGSIPGSNPGSVPGSGSGSGSSDLNSAPPTTTTTPVGVSIAHSLAAPSSIQVSPANASSKITSTSTTNTTNTTTTSPNNNILDPSSYKRPNLHSFDSNEDWLTEFINAPIETEFPTVSNHIGFADSPVDETNEALGEFASRSTSNPMPLHYNQNTNNPNYVPYNPHDPNHNGNPNNNNHIHQNHQHVHPYPAQNIHPQQQQQQQQQQQHPNFGGAQQFQPKGGNNSTHQNHQFNPSNSGSQASSTNDLSQFFRSRQMDLYKHISFDDSNSRINIAGRCTSKIRNHIMETYHLKESQFPVLHDLNHYLQLYEIEFNKYFPFIHIPSLNVDDNLDQIPLLLSMSAIGALYSFHARNSSTLFNFSRFLIHNYMENQMSNNLANVTDVPLHITQSLLLHMFLGMFHNDIEVTKLTQRQLASLVALVKSTNLDKPLDSFIMPPNINETLNLESENLKACHDYFIFAQSRIRTIHCLHYLCVLFVVKTEQNGSMF